MTSQLQHCEYTSAREHSYEDTKRTGLVSDSLFWLDLQQVNMHFCANRAEEMNNSQLAELEDDIQLQLARTEERVRDEVSGITAGFILDGYY